MPRLSILIPHLDSPRIVSDRGTSARFENTRYENDSDLESTLLAVLESSPSDSEVIVAHSGSYTDPYNLDGNEVKMIDVGEGAGFGELLNSALSHSKGLVIETLLPGCIVSPGWADAALEHFDDLAISSVSPQLIANDSKERPYFALDPICLPRRAWSHHNRSGEFGVATLCGGFFRRSSLVATSGWLGTAEQTVARETAEAELGFMFKALGLLGVCEPDSIMTAPKRTIEGKLGGYALGHDAGRLAVAFAEVAQNSSGHESIATRLGYLAGGLISPKSVAERLGWVLGSTDRSLVADIRWRLARAEMELSGRQPSNAMKIAA